MLTDLLGAQRGVAVVALGGYARRELCPASDIDLLLLHDGWGRGDLESVVQQLCYPLWDAGLSVGHAVRSPAEAVNAAGERVDTATAVLDRRLVAGDRGLLDALASRVDRWVKRQRRRLMLELATADEERHQRYGDHPGALEPELKNGAGGLRDLHSLRWAGGWALGEMNLDALVAAGYVGASDRRSLSMANATLLEARCALHLARPTARGRDADVLRLQDHDDVAALLGLRDGDGHADGDSLLRRVGLATRTVSHVHGRAWPLLLSDAGGRRRLRVGGRQVPHGVRLNEGLVEIDPPDGDDPAWALEAVAVAAQQRAHLTRRSASLVEVAVRERAPLAWTAGGRAALLDILRAPGVLRGLQDADHLGVLSAYLPEWEVVRGRPQRNPLHRFDLDTHGAHAVATLPELVGREDLAALWDGLDHADTLLLALWLHDVGKAWPGDHSDVGATVAQRWLAHMGFDADVQRRVSHLIRWHLLLPDVATRRDLDDEREIAAVAEAVGDSDTLDALYLLSLADGRATGPAAWSAWKDSLMARLHGAVRAHLGDPLPTGIPTASSRDEPLSRAEQDLISDAAPRAYLETADLAQQAAHAALLGDRASHDGLRAAVRPGAVEGTAVVSVVAPDRAGLFADCAGVFSAHDLDVVEARAFTGPGGIALDWFTIDGWVDRDAVLPDLADVGAGRRSVEQLLTGRRRSRRVVPEGDVKITVRDQFTVEIQAPDSPGLLYRLCTALGACGLNVTAARISSIGPAVFDVFEVVPSIGTGQTALKRALVSAAAPTN